MEKKFHEEFLELHKKGTSVRRWWFSFHRRQILNDLYSEEEFKLSDHWFVQFSKRKGILLKKKAHKRQKDPANLKNLFQQFHAIFLRGNHKLRDLGNINQISLPFIMDGNKTYNSTGAEKV